MATIHDLPLETIGRIISIAYAATSGGWAIGRERNRYLKVTSLVCREWRPFAQRELWIDVSLAAKSIDSFLAADPGRYRVQALSIDCRGMGDDSAASVEAVLRDVRGVRDLHLSDCSFGIERLCGSNFKGTPLNFLE